MRLPKEYLELEYIQSSGSQYINSNVNINYDDDEIDLKYSWVSFSGSTWDMVFGATSSDSRSVFIQYNHTEGTGQNATFGRNVNGVRKDIGTATIGKVFEVSQNKNRVIANGTTFTYPEIASGSDVYNYFIFARNESNAPKQYSRIKLYYFKIKRNGTLVRDFVPSKRLSDGAFGLYDLVDGTFHTNQGSGTFIGGSVVADGLEEDFIFDENPLNFKASMDIIFEAKTRLLWTITLDYDATLGQASYEWGEGNNAILKAIPNDNAQFKGWYYESELISTNLETEVEVNHNTTYRAIFERVYDVNTSVVGLGDVQVTRQTDRNIVVVSVIPHLNWSFEKYVVDGVETTQNPLPLSLNGDVNLVAHFVEDEKFHISATTNVPNGTIYISKNDDYDGYESTLYARPIPNYVFDEWDDGNKDNPRNIVVTSNVTYLAKYTKVAESNGIYQYRCFVKDQLDLEAPPKAFMIVDTFTIKTDLMTNAKSSMKVVEMASNVNNGDVIVLYNPKGDVLYQGVVTAIEDLKISCSQMQSYFKGLWVYNVSPKPTLEEEVATLLQDYIDGKMYGSTYIDRLVAQRLGGITIDYTGGTTANLPNDLDDKGEEKFTTMDMEKFIYSLYENYGIIFDFEINFSGTNYVHIKVPNYEAIKVGNNMYAIQNMSPIETIEETNRLIVYSSSHEYRKTYIATKSGIVEEPTSTANRFDITNTKIVFSDDELPNLVANNLPSIMYNHKLTFELVIKNFIYEFNEFKMGMPLDVWYGSDYFNSVLTGYEMKKTSNKNVTMVSFTCGKVRNSLTQRLTLGVL